MVCILCRSASHHTRLKHSLIITCGCFFFFDWETIRQRVRSAAKTRISNTCATQLRRSIKCQLLLVVRFSRFSIVKYVSVDVLRLHERVWFAIEHIQHTINQTPKYIYRYSNNWLTLNKNDKRTTYRMNERFAQNYPFAALHSIPTTANGAKS